MLKQMAAASAMNLLDNKLKTSERAQAQRYATMMSNSAYQRAMKDMRKAGLNPILAGKYGGASTPSVAQAPVGVKTGEFMQQMSSAKSTLESAKLTKQETRIVKTNADYLARNGLNEYTIKYTVKNILGSKVLQAFEDQYNGVIGSTTKNPYNDAAREILNRLEELGYVVAEGAGYSFTEKGGQILVNEATELATGLGLLRRLIF
jgi:hypothetical protein